MSKHVNEEILTQATSKGYLNIEQNRNNFIELKTCLRIINISLDLAMSLPVRIQGVQDLCPKARTILKNVNMDFMLNS